MRFLISTCFAVILAASLTACQEEDVAELPPPVPLTQEPVGYYCSMTVADHHGPKGQIRLKSQDKPIWFSSVRDTITFTLLAEEPKDILVIYVTDMSKTGSWENPKNNDWIEAKSALFVTGSSKNGGMGAPEPVPFASKEAAETFVKQFGGKIVAFLDISDGSSLGPVEISDIPRNKDNGG